MNRTNAMWRRKTDDGERGVSAVEYAVIIAAISVLLIGIVGSTAPMLSAPFEHVIGALPDTPTPTPTTSATPDPITNSDPLPRPWLPPSWVTTGSGDPTAARARLSGNGAELGNFETSGVGCGGTSTVYGTDIGPIPASPGIGNIWSTDAVELGPDPCQFTVSYTNVFNNHGILAPTAAHYYGAAICLDGTVASVGLVSGTNTASGEAVYSYAGACDGRGVVEVGISGSYTSAITFQRYMLVLASHETSVTCRTADGDEVVVAETTVASEPAPAPQCPVGSVPVRIVVDSTRMGNVIDASINDANTGDWLTVSSMYSQVSIAEDSASGWCGLVMPDGSRRQLTASDCSTARNEGVLT